MAVHWHQGSVTDAPVPAPWSSYRVSHVLGTLYGLLTGSDDVCSALALTQIPKMLPEDVD